MNNGGDFSDGFDAGYVRVQGEVLKDSGNCEEFDPDRIDTPTVEQLRNIETFMANSLKDSGKREEFSTGSRRDSREGKGRFDLLFMGMPEALRRLAVLLERGAAKYGERNWEKGQPISRYIDSAVRHLHRAAQGQVDEDHLVQAAWNCLAAVETLHRCQWSEHEKDRLPSNLNDVYESPDVEPK